MVKHFSLEAFDAIFLTDKLPAGSPGVFTNVALRFDGWTANVFELMDMDGFHQHFSKSTEG